MQAMKSGLTGLHLVGRPGYWDIAHNDGKITSIRPSQHHSGGVVMPLMADIHTHLDKTFTASRMPRRAGSLFDAIDMMAVDAKSWTPDDLHLRASKALAKAYHHGTAMMRSHVDWHNAAPPPAWSVLQNLAQTWRGGVDLQLASLTPLDQLVEIGPSIAAQLYEDGGILGAFVYCNDNLAAKIKTVFDLAEQYGLDLDFHVDEGLDLAARGIDAIINETEKRGMAGRVLCGHGCALSLRSPDELGPLFDKAAAAGIGLTVLPGANTYLQDATAGRTPRQRGLAPLQEADEAGVAVMIGSDNVRDGFFPFGDYDLGDVFRHAVLAGHLPPDHWIDAISERPANWMGQSLRLVEGGPASFIWLDADDLHDVLSRPRAERRIWRQGRIVSEFQGEMV